MSTFFTGSREKRKKPHKSGKNKDKDDFEHFPRGRRKVVNGTRQIADPFGLLMGPRKLNLSEAEEGGQFNFLFLTGAMALVDANQTEYEMEEDYYEEMEGERAIWQLTKNYFRIFCKILIFSVSYGIISKSIFLPQGKKDQFFWSFSPSPSFAVAL